MDDDLLFLLNIPDSQLNSEKSPGFLGKCHIVSCFYLRISHLVGPILAKFLATSLTAPFIVWVITHCCNLLLFSIIVIYFKTPCNGLLYSQYRRFEDDAGKQLHDEAFLHEIIWKILFTFAVNWEFTKTYYLKAMT